MFLRATLLLFFPITCFCQNQFRFEHFGIKEGLSQNTVHCILKDKEGYYWFGTQDGLNKYDGYTVKIFRHERNDSTTISDNFILNLLEDNYGNLWIGTRNGFNYLDKKTERFTRIIINPEERTFYHNVISTPVKDKEGNIFFSNTHHQWVRIVSADTKSPPFSPQIIKNNIVSFKTSDETYCLKDLRSNEISFYNTQSSRAIIRRSDFNTDRLIPLLETDGKIFFKSGKGLAVSSKKMDPLPQHIFLNKKINTLLSDTKKNIWVGTSEGLYLFISGNFSSTPILLSHSTGDSHSLSSSDVLGLYEDPDGLIWVSSPEAGMSIFDASKNVFSIFNHNSSVRLSENSVFGIYQDKNELWIGTNSGLNHLIFENENITAVYDQKNKLVGSEIIFYTSSSPHSIVSNFITCIVKDKEGNLWLGSHNGISIYNPSSKKWKQINTKNSPLKSGDVFHLMCASDGKIWISTLNSFYSYNPSSQKFSSFLSAYEGGIFPAGYTMSTYEDKDSSIWVASTGGIYHIKNTGEKIAFYFSEADNPTSLSYNICTSFLRDSEGRLWVTTLGGGINLFDERTASFRSFTKKDGLSNNIIHSVIEDKKKNLWLSTHTGLSCFNPQTLSFTNYTIHDGLPANEFCQNAAFKNTVGELFFGSPEGLVVFNPNKLNTHQNEIPILLSSLKINYEPRYIPGKEPIDLYYRDKTVSFEFASPDFRNQESIHYAFKLEGFYDNWTDIPSSNRIASFTNLPFGNYTFKVRVKKGNEEWQKNILSIKLNVIPPFWLTTWFIFLEIFLGLFIAVFLAWYYTQRKLKKHLRKIEMQQKIHLERERISRDLHDNVGSHLTYIIMSLDGICNKIKTEEKYLSEEKIASLSDFARTTMRELRETIWAINKEHISLIELKDKISEYCNRMTSAINVNFKLQFLNVTNTPLKPSLAINIYRLVQEAVHNAVKHSEAKSLLVIISNSNEDISIEVIDDGKGINEASKKNGYGLKNMETRVKDLKGVFSIDSDWSGTKIRFVFPPNTERK